MKATDVTAGARLHVPAGADLSRRSAYYCRVDRVEAIDPAGNVHVFMTKTRGTGQTVMTRRQGRRVAATGYAVLDPAQLAENMPAWYAPGADVVELEYLGHGHYYAERVTVRHVTPAQITTSSGRRFWRKTSGLVGQGTKRAAGIQVNPVRIVPTDNPHAVAYFEGKR